MVRTTLDWCISCWGWGTCARTGGQCPRVHITGISSAKQAVELIVYSKLVFCGECAFAYSVLPPLATSIDGNSL